MKFLLSRFAQDRNGSILPIFALTLMPITVLMGIAVDYSRANAFKASMQAAVDSTILAMSKTASGTSPDQISVDAQTYFTAVLNRSDVQAPQVSVNYSNADANGSQLVMTASASIDTTFLGLAGLPQISVQVSGTATWGNARLRVALALDNTGSMADDGKMTALKTATHNLLTQLKNAAHTDGDVYVSIIPFSKDVNAGAGNYDKSWVDFSTWDTLNGSCSKDRYNKQSTCLNNGGTWTPDNHDTWNGCVMDRDQNYDEKNTTPTGGNKSTLFPAEQYSSCPKEVTPQTYDWTKLNAAVDAMQPAGNTNQGIGLVWAWQSLTPSDPFNPPAKDPNYVTKDIIILLTDGVNTQNRYSQSQSAIDSRQQVTCTNIKNASVILYTVQVDTGSGTESAMLKSCATDTNKYFMLTDANQIITTFDSIGTALTKLHLAK